MKLLFVFHRRDISGGEICTLRILERLHGHAISAILPEGALSRELDEAGISVHIENELVSLSRNSDPAYVVKFATRFPGLARRLARKIREIGPDLVVSNGLGPLPYVGPASRVARVPNICIHYHPVIRPGTGTARMVRVLSPLCDGFIAVSDAMKRGLESAGISSEKIATIYNGLDLSDYVPSERRSNLLRGPLNVDPAEKWIGLVATISENKGHHVAIEAARLLRDEFKVEMPWKLVFIGGIFENDPQSLAYQARLQRQIEEAQLQDRVIFAGRYRGMRDVYADLDIVLNASVEPEPLGTTIYEAMAMGKTVIANTLGGSPEIVGEDQTCGFLVPPDDSRALASALENILSGKTDLAPIRQAARRRVESLFDLAETVRRYVAYFEAHTKKN